MPRKRKTLEQHLTELIDEFTIVRVKAAIDMMDYCHRNGKSVLEELLWSKPVPQSELPKGEPRISGFTKEDQGVKTQAD
jgi:hypothetical protein